MDTNTNTENQVETSACTTGATCSAKPLSPVVELKGLIDAGISQSSEAVKQAFIKQNVDQEIARRVVLLQNLYTAIMTAKKEFNKFKADDIKYDATGKVVGEFWTKTALEARKKAEEKLTKAEKVLQKVLSENDYSQVDGVINELKATAPKSDNKSAEAKSE